MKGKGTSLIRFGVAIVLNILLVSLGAQEGQMKRVFAARPATSIHSARLMPGPGCTNNDLKGMFGFYRIGATDVPAFVKDPTTKQLVPPSPPPSAPFSNPLASVGIIEFYGTGLGASYQRTNKEGVLSPGIPPAPTDSKTQIDSAVTKFSYAVTSDCTFLVYSETFFKPTQTFLRTYAAQGVIVGNGDEFYMMSMTAGSAVVVVAKKSPTQALENFY